MTATSLKTRLLLAFLAVVSLMVAVGIASYYSNHRIQAEMSDLRASLSLDLRDVDLEKVALEIEGFWDSGRFVATDVEVLPGPRRPKLRGPIQSVDLQARTMTVYGVPILVDDETELVSDPSRSVRLADLAVGTRVEVTCDIVGPRWEAGKIRATGVKASDKIKGTATTAALDGIAPETLEIHGLEILLDPAPRETQPEGALHRIKWATQMTLALQECRAAANELAGRAPQREDRGEDHELDRDTLVATSAQDRLRRAERAFANYLEQSRGGAGDSRPVDTSSGWLQRLVERQPVLHEHVETLLGLAREDPWQVRAYVDDTFSPFLEDDLLTLVYAYLSWSEEELGDQLRAIVSNGAATTRLVLITSGVAALAALALGLLVWRSIHRPIMALHGAAQRIGLGDLDTRVEISTHDEFGVLADAFNRMASELAATTVSMGDLDNIFDSMAGALIICDADGRVTNVNRAAQALLGGDREAMIGRPFGEICSGTEDGHVPPLSPPGAGEAAKVTEVEFHAADGRRVPASLSGAELRTRNGALQGYVCVAQDLTERKRIEERIRSSLAEKELLLREVHHRVKNNMQVISSLLAMQANQSRDPLVTERLEESQSRIRSMALIHEQLYRSSDLAAIDVRPYLEMLIDQLSRSLRSSESVRLDVNIEDLAMNVDQSLACGLIVNELVANAFKHAFADGESGRIRISLIEAEGGQCVLTVADDGQGMAPSSPAPSATLGTSLVRMLVKQLGGRMDVRGDDGVRVEIVFPRRISEVTAA